jgi:hypothetical protein
LFLPCLEGSIGRRSRHRACGRGVRQVNMPPAPVYAQKRILVRILHQFVHTFCTLKSRPPACFIAGIHENAVAAVHKLLLKGKTYGQVAKNHTLAHFSLEENMIHDYIRYCIEFASTSLG